MRRIILAGLPLAFATPAFAYIGPGAGIGLLGALWGLLAVLVAALGFVLLWPLRRLRRRRRLQQQETGSDAQPACAPERERTGRR